MDEITLRHLLPKRPKDSHKGTFGHALNIAGSKYYSGAAYFSSIAPLKVGCGRSTLASVESVIRSVSALSPDIIFKPLPESDEEIISSSAYDKISHGLKNYDAISIGCGLSVSSDTEKLFRKLIQDLEKTYIPLVIDADGINILATVKSINLPQKTILTPHPLELSRLLKEDVGEILADTEFFARKCSKKYNCVTVLKTCKTVVCDKNGEIYINNTGNSALAHGGSGDILCGMIAGLLAQGMNPYEASILAVHLHGKTAELASENLTEYSTLASDLLDYIHIAVKNL